MKNQLFTILLSLFFSHAVAQNLPYQNPNLSAQERARDLCSRLTLEEKEMYHLYPDSHSSEEKYPLHQSSFVTIPQPLPCKQDFR